MRSRLALAACGLLGMAALGFAGEATQAARQGNTFDAIMGRLNATVVSIEADKVNPDKVLDQIRKEANVNIVVDQAARKVWENEQLTLKLKDVSAFSALSHILRQLDVAATYEEDALVIAAPQAVQPHPRITIYPVKDIVEPIRSFRTPPMLFGSQIDPLYYYWIRTQLGPVSGSGNNQNGFYDPFWEFDLIDRYPPDSFGQVLADTIERQVGGKELGISVTYRDGYLIVVEQPKPPRIGAQQADGGGAPAPPAQPTGR